MSLWEKMRGCPRANEHEKLAIAYYAELAKAHNAAAATQAETEERVNAPTSTDVIDDDKALEEMLWASNKAALAIWTRDQDQALEAELHRREEAELAQQASEKEEWEDLIRSQVLAWIESGGYAPSNPPQVSGDMPAQTKSEEVKEAKSSSPREDTGDKTVTAPAVVRALALAPAPAAPAASTYMGELEAEKVKLLEEISRLNPVKHVSWLNLKLRQIEELRQEMRRLEDQPALATPKELDWKWTSQDAKFPEKDEDFSSPANPTKYPYDEYTAANLPAGWFKGVVLVKKFDGAVCGKCGQKHETQIHHDCVPGVLNYGMILMDKQSEGLPPVAKCTKCKRGGHHPENCGKLALYDLDTNKPLPDHLRVFELKNPNSGALTNLPLYYYTGGAVLDKDKKIFMQNFVPPALDEGEEPWRPLPADLKRLEGGIWRKMDKPNVALRFAFNEERKRRRLPIPREDQPKAVRTAPVRELAPPSKAPFNVAALAQSSQAQIACQRRMGHEQRMQREADEEAAREQETVVPSNTEEDSNVFQLEKLQVGKLALIEDSPLCNVEVRNATEAKVLWNDWAAHILKMTDMGMHQLWKEHIWTELQRQLKKIQDLPRFKVESRNRFSVNVATVRLQRHQEQNVATMFASLRRLSKEDAPSLAELKGRQDRIEAVFAQCRNQTLMEINQWLKDPLIASTYEATKGKAREHPTIYPEWHFFFGELLPAKSPVETTFPRLAYTQSYEEYCGRGDAAVHAKMPGDDYFGEK